MELSSEEFAGILRDLRDTPVRIVSGDRRIITRVEKSGTVVITLCRESDDDDDIIAHLATTVTVRNVSNRGIGIIYHRPLARGQQFVIALRSPVNAPVSFLCTVAHCRTISSHQFVIGAELTCMVADRTPASGDDETTIKRIRAAILS